MRDPHYPFPHILAAIYFRSAEQGGRESSTVGDAPGFFAEIDGESFEARVYLRGLDPPAPGSQIIAPIYFMHPDFVMPLLSDQKLFALRDIRHVADVRILQIYLGPSELKKEREKLDAME